jgi:predicted outer membrane repeat protein
MSISDDGEVTIYGCTNWKKTITNELILSEVGTLSLNWVTLQNVYSGTQFEPSGSSYGGAIFITGTVNDDNKHRTDIRNCIIENCADNDGGAMAIRMSNNDSPKDTYPDNTSVTLTNTEIRYCYTTGSSGGTIRANGRTINDVILNNVKIHHNCAEASGAALLWNGAGSVETDMKINDGCHFYNNVAKTHGGAMNISSNTTFSGNVIIENNYAGKKGGGINIHAYNGGNMPKKKSYDFTYDFPDGLSVRNNHAKHGGGIAYNVDNFVLYKDWDTDPHTGVKITTTLNLKGAQIYGNIASSEGGGIWLANNLENLWVTPGKATAEIIVNLNKGSISNNISSGGNGGGIYLYKTDITRSETGATLLLESNEAQGSGKNGGGIYIENGTSINLDGVITSIKENKASNGGAIYLTGTSGIQVTLGDTTMDSNEVTGDGGAIYIKGGNLQLAKAIVQNNDAESNGGAIYVDGGGISISNTATFSSNTAGGDGGAVYVTGQGNTKGNITWTSGDMTLSITDNKAGGNGGAFFVNNGKIDASGITKATITSNCAYADGGAFYVNDGDIALCATELSENGKDGSTVKTLNGGAIALYNGTFSFAGDSQIKNNAAKNYGGALYVTNDSSCTIECDGGTYSLNKAKLGGGIYASGPIDLTFAAHIRNNTAESGGGIYLAEGANMSFGDGMIVGNIANGNNGEGGGIYLKKGTLSFTSTNNMGIYNNSASFQAADIYTSGKETTLNLPYVKDMELTDFDVPGSELYWVRDWNVKDFANQKYGRYEKALKNPNLEGYDIADMIYDVTGEFEVVTSEMCLDLGYDLVFVKVRAINLRRGDNAAIIFSYYKNSHTPGTDTPIEYRRVIFTGSEDKLVAIPSGQWLIEPTLWAITYEPPVLGIDKTGYNERGYVIARKQNKEITITFADNPDTKDLNTFDAIKKNKMRPGGSLL